MPWFGGCGVVEPREEISGDFPGPEHHRFPVEITTNPPHGWVRDHRAMLASYRRDDNG